LRTIGVFVSLKYYKMTFFLKTYKKQITFGLFLALVVSIITIRIYEAPLKNEICKQGIASFELAKDINKTTAILDSWDTNAKINMSLSLGYDYLFLLIYACFIALLIFNINERLWHNKPFYRLGVILITLIFFAAFLDIIENFALTKILTGNLQQIWASLAYYMASTKFAIILICIIYLLANWLFLLFSNIATQNRKR